jgi:hypothetical protein
MSTLDQLVQYAQDENCGILIVPANDGSGFNVELVKQEDTELRSVEWIGHGPTVSIALLRSVASMSLPNRKGSCYMPNEER